LKRVDWETVLAQTDFIIMSMLGKSLVGLVVLVAVLNAVFLPITGFEPETAKNLEAFFGVTYTLLAALLLTGIADEIGSGQAMIHLVQPITRREYIAAWLLAGPALLGVSYVIALLVPAVVLSPRMITNPAVYEPALYGLGELVYIALITLLASLVLRNKSRAVFAVIAFMFLIPAIVGIMAAIVSEALGVQISDEAMTVFISIFHPVVAMFDNYGSVRAFGLIYPWAASLLLVLIILRYIDLVEV